MDMNKETIYKSLEQVREELDREFKGFVSDSESVLLEVLRDVPLFGFKPAGNMTVH